VTGAAPNVTVPMDSRTVAFAVSSWIDEILNGLRIIVTEQ
jgi:hypothetical protein